jgi:beta-N-acetylhexosaminidase
MTGRELSSIGADLSFSPVLDIDTGNSTVIGNRAFHGSPDVVTALAAAYMRGLREAGMSATGKHFPGHGRVSVDSHDALPVDPREIEEIRSGDMLPFERLIAEGLPSIMMAHIRFPAFDPNPASLSRRWIGEELRGRLGFQGAVFCDDVSMGGAAAAGHYHERAMLAIGAGCDMLPVCNKRKAVVELLDNLKAKPNAASAARLNALRTTHQADGLPELQRSAAWRQLHEALSSLTA